MAAESLRVIIVGGGRVGFRAGQLLTGYGHDVVLIEENSARCEEIAEDLPTVIQGDATLPPIFEQAAPADSDVVAALAEDGATNLAVCLMTRDIHETIHTVLRTDTDTRKEYAGLDEIDSVISPHAAGARLSVNDIVGGAPRSLSVVTGEFEILELRVTADAPAAGERLADVSLPENSLVIADADAARVARGETVLAADHRYIVAVSHDALDEVMTLLHG